MNIDILALGAFQANCYVLTDGDDCVVIDPGGEADKLLAQLRGLNATPSAVLLTHAHPDHIAAACVVREATGAKVMVHAAEREWVEHPHPYMAQLVGGVEACPVEGELTDGQEIMVGTSRLQVLHTPGHSPGCVCFLLVGAETPSDAFTGDTLFAGSVGRTDLHGGDWNTLVQSLRRLVAQTGPATAIHPGHGPSSTMGEELRDNPYLQDL